MLRTADACNGSFAPDEAGVAYRLMFASLRKRPYFNAQGSDALWHVPTSRKIVLDQKFKRSGVVTSLLVHWRQRDSAIAGCACCGSDRWPFLQSSWSGRGYYRCEPWQGGHALPRRGFTLTVWESTHVNGRHLSENRDAKTSAEQQSDDDVKSESRFHDNILRMASPPSFDPGKEDVIAITKGRFCRRFLTCAQGGLRRLACNHGAIA